MLEIARQKLLTEVRSYSKALPLIAPRDQIISAWVLNKLTGFHRERRGISTFAEIGVGVDTTVRGARFAPPGSGNCVGSDATIMLAAVAGEEEEEEEGEEHMGVAAGAETT